ncbi:MAG: hypothetical protein Kow0056_06440 [Coriobacteriia bacterium]
MSDQDFFFDEEDEKPAKTEKPKSAKSGSKGKPAAKPAARPAATVSFWQQTVTTAVAGLVAVIALLVGVIVGIVLPVGGSSTSDVPAPDAGISAPALTPEQLESGQLPEGHPPIQGMTGAPGETATGAVESTTTTP